MPKRYFLDANVVFTAAISQGGISRAIFDLAVAEFCAVVTSDFALDEARRNMRRKYPASLPVLQQLEEHLEIVPEAQPALIAWAEDHVATKDAPILAAAVVAKVDVLVTGDRRHFGEQYGKTLRNVTILAPREALEALLVS